MAAPTERIAVLGAGLMGHGIAQCFAARGHTVGLYDSDADVLAGAIGRIRGIFDLLDQDPAGADNIEPCSELDAAVRDADFIVEAVPERLAIKQEILRRAEAAAKHDTVLASNTSAIRITDIAQALAAPERLVGTHFWNPPHLVPLVEVVQTERTDPPVVEKTMALLESSGKTPVHVRRDIPGFIGNRLQHALKREAIALVENGVCDAETVDQVVKSGFGPRLAVLGPLEQSDLVGLDLTLDIHQVLLPDLDRSAEPQGLLKRKVAAGELGMATGIGFRGWTKEAAEAVRARLTHHMVAGARRPR